MERNKDQTLLLKIKMEDPGISWRTQKSLKPRKDCRHLICSENVELVFRMGSEAQKQS